MIGQTIAHYRITDKLGEGGMGVVYKAFDTHLDRTVAIKVLAAGSIDNPERRRRFVQEAKAASALNHPNIVTIYDIDTVNGADFIAMEYVPGKTLDHWIGRKGLGLADTLKFAVQIADALSRAHGAGIVHRDLKPANIIASEDGRIKILDFGLAKLTESDSEDLAPTRTLEAAPRTEEGTIVGTVAYMSPEQAQGKKVDARSDIFAFGSVLYEMVTGCRAFQRDSKVETLSAILREEPKPVSEITEGVPRELERIIGLCLRKDPARRFQHLDDVTVELEALKEESDSGRIAAPALRRRRVPASAWVAVLLLVAATAGIAWWITRPQRQPGAPTLTRLTSDPGLSFQPALSPDGKLLAYASDRSGEGNLDIWVQQVGGGQPIRLTRDPADEHEPAFSPDGRSVAFRSERGGGGIYLAPALGGDPRLVAERGRRPRFSPDGSEIAYFVGDDFFYAQIFIVPPSGGEPRRLHTDFSVASYPVWSPDGTRLLFVGRRGTESDWWVAPSNGGTAVKTGAFTTSRNRGLVPNLTPPEVWLRGENLVFYSAALGDSTNVWRIPISPQTGQVTSEPQRVTSGTGQEVYPSAAAHDRLAFSSLNSQIDVWSLPVDANSGKVTGELQRLTDDAAVDTRPSISHDGKKLVFLSDRSGNNDVWLKDLATGKETNLTATPVPEIRVRISGDSSKVVYNQQVPNRQPAIYAAGVQGGVPKNVCADCGTLLGVSADGNKIIYSPRAGTGLHDLSLDVETDQKTEIIPSASYSKYRPLFSPDGHWLTFTASVGTNPRKVFVAPLRAATESDWIAVTDALPGLNQSDWSPDGNVIYFLSSQDGLLCIWAQQLDPATKHPAGSPFEIHHFASSRRSLNNVNNSDISLSVARDKLVFSMGERTGNIWMAEWKQP